MYLICVYDVNQKRCVKVMKTLRKYLYHVQNSVFEGELTPAKFQELKEELTKVSNDEDNICFYFTYANKQLYKDFLGKKVERWNIFI